MKIISTLILLLLSVGNAMANEEPACELIARYTHFELRQYESYIVAETVVAGDFKEVGNRGFRILFGYISGENRNALEIPMTAPVRQKPSDEDSTKIAMTAPVVQSPAPRGDNTYTIGFIMPSSFTLATLPEPLDPRISIREINGKRIAARTYKGSWSEQRYRDNEIRLLQSVKAEGLVKTGEPVFARYNSPFTLWFLRRNEVLVEVQ